MSVNMVFSLSFPEMVAIPDNEYIMGNNDLVRPKKIDDDGVPVVVYEEHAVKMDTFKISKYEVTFREYFEFLNETNYKIYAELKWLSWNENILKPDGFRRFFNASLYPDCPVTRIAYEDALMYCHWLQKKTGKVYRLPTEAEWEYAATGGQMILYPWGNEYRQMDTSHFNEYNIDANFENDIFPVNKFSDDRSRLGVYGMYGNAQEWCLDAYEPLYYYHSSYENPLQIVRKYFNDMSFRGAAGYSMETGYDNIKRRFFASPLYYSEVMGFRVVEEIRLTIFNKNTESESAYYYANGVLNDSNVNIRAVPSVEGERLFQLSKGKPVRIYLRSSRKMTIGNMTDYWYCVRRLDTNDESEMATGWVFGAYLNISQIEFNK
jgi:formylglycine-generating enzyme required for sulfatase activity